ncbi:sodium:solute symporter family protein [Edaphobacter sp. HDX4]|uniref:sodium:solute symporter family protein n=1 Tax=Edaphobacter sp. HDX4 TaxID=2794064 RepID=UPI002FE5E435
MSIIFAIVFIGSAVGFRAGAGRKMNLEEWSIASRSFGLLFMWLLMAGEIYTTFAFLGASGWAYSRGGPALYIMAYITLGYVVSFYILPYIWELGRRHGLQTQSDFFEKRYQSKGLALLVSLVGVLFVIPYLQIQLTGLGIIVQVASFDQIPRNASMLIAVSIVAMFVSFGGMRSVAWVSVIKDLLMILAALSIGIYVPIHYFGGFSPLFRQLVVSHPTHLLMPGATKTMGHTWFVSTVLLSACGFYMWPHTFGAAFTAKSGDILRRNAIVTPLYTLSLVFILIAGFAALLIVPGLSNGDMSLLMLARKTFPAWFLGVIGGAGALTAMVPAAIILLTASTLFAKNVFRPLVAPQMSEDKVARLAKVTVLALALVSFGLALRSSTTLVALLLLGYAGVTQFFPGVVFGLFWPRVTSIAVTSGLLTGLVVVAALMLTHRDPFHGINAGFVALVLNFVVTVLVSFVSPARQNPFALMEEEEGATAI